MEWKELISDRDFSLTRISTLIILLILSSIGTMEIVIPFIDNYLPQTIVHIGIFLTIESSIIGYWYYNRAVFPKGHPKKQNLVIGITTEDKRQKTRIANDFANEIKKQLRIYGLSKSYEVIVLHNYLAKTLREKIDLYAEAKQAGISESDEANSFYKIANKLNAKFFVYGDLIKRNPSNSTYCLSIEAVIMHSPVNQISSDTLHKEFSELWAREITFLEDDELNGFKSNAEHIFFTATYMLGLATFVDNKFKHGLKIWESLEDYLSEKQKLKEYVAKVKKLKATSYFLLSRILYFRGEIEESLKYSEKFFELKPNEYAQLLNEAIRQVSLNNDPKLALKHIEKAKDISQGDGTWRYSKLYLLIKLGQDNEAIQTFDEILHNNFPDENEIINQVIAYNKYCLLEDEKHIQSHFIIGSFLYKKLDQPIVAYEHLEKFWEKSEDREDMLELNKRAKNYISEIDKLVGFKKS